MKTAKGRRAPHIPIRQPRARLRALRGARALIGLVGALCLAAAPPPAGAARDIAIGSGSLSGIYQQAAVALCVAMNQRFGDRYRCQAKPSPGSVHNIDAVIDGAFQFGLGQSDRAWQAVRGQGPWTERGPLESLRSALGLHEETVLLVVREDSGIRSVRDLVGKRVNIGNPGSGHRGNAQEVLRLYGIPSTDILAYSMDQSEASRALVDGDIDAFFYTVGNPSIAIEDPAQSAGIRILPLDSPAMQEFVSAQPYYVMTELPAGTYAGIEEPVRTFAVKAALLTDAGVEAQVIYDLVRAVFERLDAVRAAHPALQHLTPEGMLETLSAPLHPGARRFFEEQGLNPR